jgi:PAS domain S-box-containing protein
MAAEGTARPGPTPPPAFEDAFEASDARYRTLVEQVPAVVYVDSNDEHPRSLYVSPQVTEILGIPPARYLENIDHWQQTMHPDDWERVQARWIDSIRTGEPFRDEYRFVRPDGEVVWVIDDSRLVHDADGNALFWHGVLQDITLDKRAEAGLRASELRFRALVERTPGVVYENNLDDERQTLYVSPQVEALFGYTRQEWLDQPDIWIELLHPDDREIVLAAADVHNETHEPWSQEYRLIASDGHVVWVHDEAIVFETVEGGAPTWQGIMLDITAQKGLEEQLRDVNDALERRVEERTAELAEANEMMALEIGERRRIEAELRETRERYRHLIEDVPAVVCVWKTGSADSRDPSNYTSPQIEVLVGYRVDEWNDTALWESRLHPHDRDRVMADVMRSESTGEPLDVEYRLLAKDGRVVWVLDHATLLSRDENGNPSMFQGILLDITARKLAELKAAEAEKSLHTFAETGPVANFVYELVREPELGVSMRFISPHPGRILGGNAREWNIDTPDQLLALIHPDDRDETGASIEEQWRTGADFTREFRLIAPDGRIIWVYNSGRCIARDEQGRPLRFHSALLDITDRKMEEERIRESERRLRSFVDGVPGIPWMEIVDGEPGTGRIVFLGPQVEAILGYTPEELLAEPGHVERMVHPDDRERMKALSAEHDRTGEPWWAEYRSLTRDGRELWLRSQGLASRDEQGRLVWRGVTYDVTDQRSGPRVRMPDVESVETPG